MALYFISGVSGTGKTTLMHELQSRGKDAHDTDIECIRQSKLTGEIVNYGTTPFLQEGYIKSKQNVTNPIINLKSISLLINGITFPSENYNFNFTINTSATNAGTTTLNIYNDPLMIYTEHIKNMLIVAIVTTVVVNFSHFLNGLSILSFVLN